MIAATTLPSPVLEQTDDDLLARNVVNFILPRVYPISNHVQVEANRGVVTLTGRVGSFYYKQLWLSGAQRVAGVRRVIDEIEVVNLSQEPYRRARG
ncbi:MAG: BON domain-containing protein [Pirellulaceae bacterium]